MLAAETSTSSTQTHLVTERHFTKDLDGKHPLDCVSWAKRDARIVGANGKIVFEQKDVEAPLFWSDQAVNIVVQKYFAGKMGTESRETSIRQMILRVVDTITQWVSDQGYTSDRSVPVFQEELCYLLVNQMVSFNSPCWFNIGVKDVPQQASACFILSVEDSMESILEWYKEEGLIFKSGSGSGTNLSRLRSASERLSGGGYASGPVSFMRGADSSAGAIKSGGRTRRAAKLVCLDVDHPDIQEFIWCKAREEEKAKVLKAAGFDVQMNGRDEFSVQFQNANNSVRVSDYFMKLSEDGGVFSFNNRADDAPTPTVMASDLLDEISEAAWRCGCPGLQFDDTCNEWNTCSENGKINSTNPCQPGFATVLTPEGIRTFDEIDVGSTIWSGLRWTKVKRKIATGVKPVQRYNTRAGSFIGTEQHRVFSAGERIEVGEAETIDTCVAEIRCDEPLDSQAIIDGLYLGDGSCIHANGGRNTYTVLHVGDDDQSYFDDPALTYYINPTPYDKKCHRIETTLQDVGRTYERDVPTKYFEASPSIARSFLRGLYAANGSICGKRVTLKASSFRVIERVQQMLSSVGIRSYYTTNRSQTVKFSNGSYECKESYDLNVSTDIQRFNVLIGFIQPYKQEKLDKLCAERKTLKYVTGPKTSYEIVDVDALGEMPVYDIEVEADEHSYWTGGLLVSNCSEFSFLDNTSCNLASLNLVKFQDTHGILQCQDFSAAVSVTLLAMEAMVSKAHYPTQKITEMSHRFRPLGLGYTNLGAYLMRQGRAYDSDDARNEAAMITDLLQAACARTSAAMAKAVGPFDGYVVNHKHMTNVIDKHIGAHTALKQRVANGTLPEIIRVASDAWTKAKTLAEVYGYRNAQFSVLAPTGTISFMMGCDTTGIEPELSLVKHKTLAGGGNLKIVNQSVEASLERLGYDSRSRTLIVESLVKGMPPEDCPQLRPEHKPVFMTSFPSKKDGVCLSWQSHIEMMTAVQPFISGAISKTVNLPSTATVKDVRDAYVYAWKSGLKAIAIYRDGCKHAQPLETKKSEAAVKPTEATVMSTVKPTEAVVMSTAKPTEATVMSTVKPVVVKDDPDLNGPPSARRQGLPDERSSITHKFTVGGHEGYVTVGMYENGQPGEMFVRMAKEGSTISGLLDGFATSISIGLQHGVELKTLINKFSNARFEPSGMTENKDIRFAKSILDYIFRWLELKFEVTDDDDDEEEVETVSEGMAPLVDDPMIESDAPLCPDCGSQMVRRGTCHSCDNCGATGGCS